jgi:hypothetical protein
MALTTAVLLPLQVVIATTIRSPLATGPGKVADRLVTRLPVSANVP